MTMTTIARPITGGVDTHLDVHVAAALEERGALLGVERFSTTPSGYRALLSWLESFGTLELVGVEGTGSFGAGLTRHLLSHKVTVVEVDRPNRQRRRRKGKSDPEDAVAAARSAQGGDATGSAKTRDGNVEAMRVLRVARRSARSSRTQAINQMRSLVSTAPDELRAERRDLSIYKALQLATAFRHTGKTDVAAVTKLTLRTVARRALSLEEEVKEIDRVLKTLVAETAPELNAVDGVGTDVASALLVAAGDNPERLKNEATLAKLCGVSPLDASSGKQHRHRLNRGGDRQANSALWHIVFTRMGNDPRTKHYIERRMKEGRTKKEAIRCLKRYVAREVFAQLPGQQSPLTIHRSINRGYPDRTHSDVSGCRFSCDYETRVLPSRKGSVSLDLVCDCATKFTHYLCPSRILYPVLEARAKALDPGQGRSRIREHKSSPRPIDGHDIECLTEHSCSVVEVEVVRPVGGIECLANDATTGFLPCLPNFGPPGPFVTARIVPPLWRTRDTSSRARSR